ncbi:MAG TPA: gamma-glutamyl-gamma-aminobutyrate hydrolase family protein [Candidatus Brocadiia bacterium]|nr:gamma-glutamyl-gamma-aminobutyrate hydrolase family protein [Candidatus Brocadiia bacterium]
MKPIIGINCDLDLKGAKRPRLVLYINYFEAILNAGGLPLLIPFMSDEEDIRRALAGVDGLLLTGGGDIDPAMYGEPLHPETDIAPEMRLKLDLPLAREALLTETPVLGICMGNQVLNVAAGGTLIQDIKAASLGTIPHRQMESDHRAVHDVIIESGSMLAGIVGPEPLGVNTTHHHAAGRMGKGFRIAARATDGTIEAIENAETRAALGVQWHPERLCAMERHRKLFEWLVATARSGSKTGK